MEGGGLKTLSTGQCATLACLLEVTTPKPGNVHRRADFESLKLNDLLVSAVAIGPAMQQAADLGVGAAVLTAVRATRALVRTNTNLGTLLLMAPLAAVDPAVPFRTGIKAVLDQLRAADAHDIYEAIRLAEPGGLGRVDELDVSGPPPKSIGDAMQAAAERDLVARQYANGFEQVFDSATAWLVEGRDAGWTLSDSIIRTHIRLMASFPDSLIARKCGQQLAEESARRAETVLGAGAPGDVDYERALQEFDSWLRSDDSRRNPGTTADLIAAGLFVGLRGGVFPPPLR